MSVKEKMTAIADAIRDKTGETSLLTLDDMATDIPKVYETGKVDEARAWWDCMTNNNTRTTYNSVFYEADFNYLGGGFNPPYTLKPLYADSMFYRSTLNQLTENEVDFSKCLSAGLLFNFCNSLIEVTGVNLSNVSAIPYAFNQIPNIRTLDIMLSEKATGNYTFWQMPKLANLTIGGAINFTATLQHSTLLTTKSIESVVSALWDNATGKQMTFSGVAKTTYYNAHSSEYENADEAWDALCDTKPNWTISLV